MSEVKVNKISPRSGTTLTIGDSGDTTNVVGTLQNNGAALTGDITSVVAGTNLTGGGTSGDVTLNLADASTSAKGAASFSSDNFAASSGAVTIKDLGVATGEIQDDAITLAKMAPGTDGNIISYDASGNPVAVATGSAAQVLTSAGAGAPPTFATATVPDDAITLAKMAPGTDGNIISYDTSGNPVAVATGSSGQVLTSAGAGAIPSFQAAAGGGKILQVKSVTFKDAMSSTAGGGSYVNITGATLAITPAATSSKIFFQAMISTGGETYGVVLKIQRGGSDISGALGTVSGSRVASTAYSSGHSSDGAELQSTYISYLDSPSSTSSLTYTVQGAARYQPAAVPWTINYPYEDTNANYTAHSVSTITLMEVGA
jgi:hypothetical protein